MTQYWLMKSEPSCFSIDNLLNSPANTTSWDGVRNYQARNFMRTMQPGDLAFFYHSSCPVPGIVGIMEISTLAYPETPPWDTIDVKLNTKFDKIIPLQTLRQYPQLANMILLRKGNRLSIMPVSKEEWRFINHIKE